MTKQQTAQKMRALEIQLDNTRRDLDSYKRLADSRQSTITNYSSSVTQLYQRLDQERSEHWRQLEAQKHEHAKKLQETTAGIVKEATAAMSELAHRHELEVARTQRDTIGEAFKYLADNLTTRKLEG